MENKFSDYLVPSLALLGLIVAAALYGAGRGIFANQVLAVTLIVGTLPLVYKMIKDLFAGHFGVDLIAIVAIVLAFFLKEYLAGTVIVLMLSGGEALEEYALRRSSRELTKLLSLAPTLGHLKVDGQIKDIPAEKIKIGDVILVKPGEIIPVDGVVSAGISQTDESSITGESRPAEKSPGLPVFSGAINREAVLEIKAHREAKNSQYQRIVALVKEAQSKRAPIVRLADRYAVWFTLITFGLALGALFATGQAIRLLAVLVVATPCPLILATPIAIISGISKSASRGIIIKNGGSLEKLGEAKAMIFDKTGTLTLGEPKVLDILAFNNFSKDDVLKFSASLDQLSAHVLARALVVRAKDDAKNLELPQNLKETLGSGVEGKVSGKIFAFGKLDFLKSRGVDIASEEHNHRQLQSEGKITVYLAQLQPEKKLLGCVIFADVLRPDIKHVFSEMQQHNMKKIFMLTGDKEPVAKKIAGELGIKDFKAETLPEDKVNEVQKIRQQFSPLVMVGDGINDAPALAAADVGIALAAHGSSAASESADIVIMQNNIMRVHDALHIAQSVMRIAKQSIFAGIGVSILLMIIAAFGYIQPVYGAILQEVIDVAVILNALRVNFEKVE